MERRDFIRTNCLACLGWSTILTTLTGCISAYYAKQVDFKQNNLIVKKSEFVEIKKDKKIIRNVIVAKYEKLGFPIALFRLGEEQYSAVYLECTHQGNEVQPHGDYLVCEGHGSEFDNKGKVTQGPAEKPLRTFMVKTDQENIYIDLS
ncbi:Rieske-like 2Fe-2S protein [Arcicella aurantiaca]|uniref:Rieske-like 2Fe-2S protein n=1 Tax=Arcicella aurantiaca TaxID=591202 RepID=A0A316DHG4_9BACT|nr:Rieske (2Fe-2S) protein [Arcicella aurantiaca]PWK17088.1 Rieske-like 2Fe-2S protein [Arcicella aurantiaca]